MGRPKSEFVSACGTMFEIFKAEAEEVYALGGTDNDIRRLLTDQELRRQRARLLVNRPSFTVHVNHDDPDHRRIDREQYLFVDGGLSKKDFPIMRTGKEDVAFTILECRSWEEYFEKVEAAGNLRPPDIAETRDFHKAHPEERMKGWLGAPCGAISDRNDNRSVAYLSAGADGFGLGWGWLRLEWGQALRCLAVRK